MKKVISVTLMFVVFGLWVGLAAAADLAVKGNYEAKEEVLHGITVEPETVSIDVRSSGCTDESDFKWAIRMNRKTGETLATVFRIEPDLCKAYEHNVTLTFKRTEIGLDGVDMFLLTNAFRGFPRF